MFDKRAALALVGATVITIAGAFAAQAMPARPVTITPPDHTGMVLMWKPSILVCQNGIKGRECVPQNAIDVMKGAFEPAFNETMCDKYAMFSVAKAAQGLHITLDDGVVVRLVCEKHWVSADIAADAMRSTVGQAGAHKVDPKDIIQEK
jgi:hypothetical protein